MKKHAFRVAGFVTGVATCLGMLVGHASAAGFTCTWTGAGSDTKFSTAANWSSCNSVAPTNGDNLVFNGSAASLLPNNDLSGRTFGSLTFTGTAGFDVSGNAFTLTGGIIDNATGNATNTIENSITFSGSQSISGTHAPTGGSGLILGIGGSTVLTIPGGTTLTITSISPNAGASLSGAGTLTFSGTTPAFTISMAATNFTGAVIVPSGANMYAAADNTLGSAAVTVASGGVLYIGSSQTNLTLSNAFTLGGTGLNGTGGALNITAGTGGKITLSGPVTLTADAKIDPNNSSVAVTGTYTPNGHVLGVLTGSITLPSSSSAAPAAPKTGLAAVKSNPALISVLTSGAALLLGGLSYRLRSAATRK